MKKFTRVICMLLCLCFIASAVACTGGGDSEDTDTGSDAENTVTIGNDTPDETQSGTTEPGTDTTDTEVDTAEETTSESQPDPESNVAISDLQVNYLKNPVGIDDNEPEFSWVMSDIIRGQKQTAYRICVASSSEKLKSGDADVWDSGKIESDNSSLITYGGAALADMSRYYWTVTVWDKNGNKVDASETAYFETGLGEKGFSDAEWIMSSYTKVADAEFKDASWLWLTEGAAQGSIPGGTQYFRRSFTVSKEVESAYMILTADDYGSIYCNGQKVNEVGNIPDIWKTGRLIDITKQIAQGGNAVSAEIVNKDTGYAGFICKVIINYKDKTNDIYNSDASWKVSKTKSDGFYNASFDDSSWSKPDQIISFGDNPWLTLVSIPVGAEEDECGTSAPMLRKEFTTEDKTVESARIYATSAGIYDLFLNGKRVGDAYLTPSWTEYDEHLMYQTYDVTDSIKSGANVVGAQLGNGWYIGLIASYGGQNPAFICKTVIKYTDRSVQTVCTDGSWQAYTKGPVTANDLFNGETYDATMEPEGWNLPGFDAKNWKEVGVTDAKKLGIGDIISQISENIKVMKTVTAVSVNKIAENTYIYDFGQNLSGVVQITLTGEAGQRIKLRHAEMLNDGSGTGDGKKGTLYIANLRSALDTDYYIMKGSATGETWYPTLTYRGFRYVEISGISEPLPLEAVVARVLYTSMEDTATFECSDELINRLALNAYWGQCSNFLSVPTDCPQRDERMGWTGDAEVFCGTAAYNMNVKRFYDMYIMDLNDTQQPNGAYTDVAPGNKRGGYDGSGHGGWADAGIIIPYTMYQRYGDITMIQKYWTKMTKYIRFLVNDAGKDYIRDTQNYYGDWLSIGESTPVAVTDTAYCAYVCKLMSEMATILGKEKDAETFDNYYMSFCDAWCGRYLNADGTTKCGTQTSYVLGLYFEIIPEELRYEASLNLATNIANKGWKLSTGFLGVSYLLPVLCEYGYQDVAFRLLEQKEYPSWLYPVLQGATTIWERWNSYTVESGFGDAGMNSFNHYSYGSVMEWVYSYVLGIKYDSEFSAFKHFILQPHYGGKLTYAEGSYDSQYGLIESGWKLENGIMTYKCTVPANTTATLYLPGDENAVITESGKPVAGADGVTYDGYSNGTHMFELVSGSYEFSVPEVQCNSGLSLVSINNPENAEVEIKLDGVTVGGEMTLVSSGAHKLEVNCKDDSLAFAYIDGTQYISGYTDNIVISGDEVFNLHFAYKTGKATTGKSKITVNADCDKIYVNNKEEKVPFTGEFDNGSYVVVELDIPDGKTFGSWNNNMFKGYPLVLIVGGDITLNAQCTSLQCSGKSLSNGIKATGNDISFRTTGWSVGGLTDGVTKGTGYTTDKDYPNATLTEGIYLDFAFSGAVDADRVVLWPRTDIEATSTGKHCFPQDFTLSVLCEGDSSYTEVASFTGMDDMGTPLTIDFESKRVTHIRLDVTKLAADIVPGDTKRRLQFAEIQVFNTSTSEKVNAVSSIDLTYDGLAYYADIAPENAYVETVSWFVYNQDGSFADNVSGRISGNTLKLSKDGYTVTAYSDNCRAVK